ncbi:hypothetical protein KM043_010308 [Ampulex compressa]|nr:hypothetical protein KM043_010308 [Ampulex compressa]
MSICRARLRRVGHRRVATPANDPSLRPEFMQAYADERPRASMKDPNHQEALGEGNCDAGAEKFQLRPSYRNSPTVKPLPLSGAKHILEKCSGKKKQEERDKRSRLVFMTRETKWKKCGGKKGDFLMPPQRALEDIEFRGYRNGVVYGEERSS